MLKNNDHLAKLAASPLSSAPARSTQDQGFARPKVLVLAPFRNSAHAWVELLTTISQADAIENKARFDAEFSLPPGAVDKLVENPGNYSADHVETFKGNIDDSFRIGMKVTRKTVKLFSEFYSCDVIVASPLGLRTSIEKEKWVMILMMSRVELGADDFVRAQGLGLPVVHRGPHRRSNGRHADAKLGTRPGATVPVRLSPYSHV